MSKTATEIVTRALTLLDEQLPLFTEAATTEMSLSDIALDLLPTVARNLVKELPYDLKRLLAKDAPDALVEDDLADGEIQSTYYKRKASFVAPDDFWELVLIRLTVWSKPVTKYIYIDSPQYVIQNNPFTRAGKQNPVVAISNTSADATARIECFSTYNLDAQTVENFQYVSFANVPDDDANPWPDELFDHITKGLAMELNMIKGRIAESEIKGTETEGIIEQHK